MIMTDDGEQLGGIRPSLEKPVVHELSSSGFKPSTQPVETHEIPTKTPEKDASW